jgi:dTMP kinase
MPGTRKYFGDGLPYRPLADLKGKLIAIEGTDGVGRTTQIDLLREWIELQGHAVLETGWTRSNLMSKTIEAAKQGNMLNRMVFSLLYATDFADRLENEIIPALESGFVVLADRYIYTAFARDWMRGQDRQWIEDVFGFAIIPDLVCYLKIDIDGLIPRVIESGGMNYWESGADLHLGDDLYDHFRKYQSRMIKEFDAMAERFGFEVIDARASVDEIQKELRAKIAPLIARTPKIETPQIPAGENANVTPLKAEGSLP